MATVTIRPRTILYDITAYGSNFDKRIMMKYTNQKLFKGIVVSFS